MPARRLLRWPLALPFLPLIAAASLQFMGADFLNGLRNTLFDQYQRWQPREYVQAPVRIIDIDDSSLKRMGQWPWPRSRIAEMVHRLGAAETAAIGFDVMFSEPDRTSPQPISDLWQLHGGLRSQVLALPDHDQVLAKQLQHADAVLGFVANQTAAEPGSPNTAGKAAFVNLGEPQNQWLPQFSHSIGPISVLNNAAKGLGALNFAPDRDGVVRRIALALQIGEATLPTLVSETLRVAQGAPFIAMRSAGHLHGLTGERDNAGLGEIKIGDLVVPTTSHGEMWVHYTRQQSDRTIPAWQLLEGRVPKQALAGHIVLIGSSAPGLMDLRFSPFGLMPGVEAHAQALEQILNGQFLERPSWAQGAEFSLMLVLGLCIGFVALHARALLAALLCVAMLAMLAGAGWYGYATQGLLLDVALPSIGVLLTFVLCSLAHHLTSEREHRWIKQAFSRYVSPNRVAYLVENPQAMELGGHRQECSFIFTDLAGFTSLMEKLDPAQAVSLLNNYLDEMIAIAFRHEGTLDRIVGDALAIMFSAPLPQQDHRARALACALEMDAFASRYSEQLQASGIAFGQTRIGIHSGEVIVGNFGGKNIFDYRALGDPVNTAARLESANKHLGTRICVSAETLRDCPNVAARPVGKLVLKGKQQPIEVFEVIVGAADRAPTQAYQQAYDAMVARSPEAQGLFRQLAQQFPQDPLAALHSRRLGAADTGEQIVMSEK